LSFFAACKVVPFQNTDLIRDSIERLLFNPKNGSRSNLELTIFFKVIPLAVIDDLTILVSCGAVENRESKRSLTMVFCQADVLQGLKRLRKNSENQVKLAESVPPRLKPHSFYGLYTGVKTPVSLRIEFFRSL
jgi:hypothetical protein